jgi:hypothetical protein
VTGGPPAPIPEVDLTEEDSKKVGSEQVREAYERQPSKPPTRSIPEMRELVRGWLAKGLVWLLILTVMSILILLATGRLTAVQASLVLSPVVALTGTALGFYFGSEKSGTSN